MNLEALLNLIFILGTFLFTLTFGLIKIKSFKGRLVLLAVILIPSIIFTYGFFVPESIFGQQSIQNFVLKFGIFSIFALILLQVLQVIIPPLDHNVVQAVGGFVFGPFLGFIFNYAGRILGSLLAFSIAKKYGRQIIEKATHDINKYDKIWDKGLLYVFLAYWLPFFPDDTMSYLAGASKVKSRTFLLILLIGHPIGVLGTTLAGSLGETFWLKNPIVWIVAIFTLLIGIIIFRKKGIATTEKKPKNLLIISMIVLIIGLVGAIPSLLNKSLLGLVISAFFVLLGVVLLALAFKD